MKCFFITALVTIFLLALFCHSGSALICFSCSVGPCNTNRTCAANEDACIRVDLGSRNVSSCWKYSDCDFEFVEKHFSVKNFKFNCCQTDLCNGGPITVYSKLVLGIAPLLAVAWMLGF